MKQIMTGIVLAVGLIASPPVAAQPEDPNEVHYTKAYRDCMKGEYAAMYVTSAVIDCNSAEIGRQDAKLNQIYKAVMARLNPRQKVKLRTLERRWVIDRDQHCRREAATEDGGSLGLIIESACMLSQTIDRTIWLEAYKG